MAKNKQYKNLNKQWTEKEIYGYLAEFLHGFDIQAIAAGPASTNKVRKEKGLEDKQYLRKFTSVDEKLKETLRDILYNNLMMSNRSYANLYFLTGINQILSLNPLAGIPKIHLKKVKISIEQLTQTFKEIANVCMIDLVKDPEKTTMNLNNNPYYSLIDFLSEILLDDTMITNLSGGIEGQELTDYLNKVTRNIELKIRENGIQ